MDLLAAACCCFNLYAAVTLVHEADRHHVERLNVDDNAVVVRWRCANHVINECAAVKEATLHNYKVWFCNAHTTASENQAAEALELVHNDPKNQDLVQIALRLATVPEVEERQLLLDGPVADACTNAFKLREYHPFLLDIARQLHDGFFERQCWPIQWLFTKPDQLTIRWVAGSPEKNVADRVNPMQVVTRSEMQLLVQQLQESVQFQFRELHRGLSLGGALVQRGNAVSALRLESPSQMLPIGDTISASHINIIMHTIHRDNGCVHDNISHTRSLCHYGSVSCTIPFQPHVDISFFGMGMYGLWCDQWHGLRCRNLQ
jgi:hypothetical protein